MTHYIHLIADEVSRNIRPNIRAEIAKIPEKKRASTDYGLLKKDIVKTAIIEAFITVLPSLDQRKRFLLDKKANQRLKSLEEDFIEMWAAEEFRPKQTA